MSVDTELMEANILMDGFNLSMLWVMREQLEGMLKNLDEIKSVASEIKIIDLVSIEKRIHFINENLKLVQYVFEIKEFDVFESTQYADICLN